MAGETEPEDGPLPRRRRRDADGSRWERLQRRAQRTRADIEARRADSASIDTAFEAVERDAQTGGGVLAAAVAFRLFMFLVPYAFVMVTGFGLSSTAAGQVPKDAATSRRDRWSAGERRRQHQHPLARQPPLRTGSRRHRVGLHRALPRPVLWIVHRLIWGVTPSGNPTPWAPLILVGFVTVLFGMVDLAAWLGSQSIGLRLVAILLMIVTSGAAWLLASWWLPREDCQWSALLPGALIVGLGVGVLHLLTITYVAHVVSRKSSLYGAIGIALALLLWTYFAGRLLTAAIAANASLWKRQNAEPVVTQRETREDGQ